MLKISDIEPVIEHEFNALLTPRGFAQSGLRRWVRSRKSFRELFLISALKGGQYCPRWGFSLGLVPALKSQRFKRQTTDKNAEMDLIIDPIDLSGKVPLQVFGFIPGLDQSIPVGSIRACAQHFVPEALADFDRVTTIADFCHLVLTRKQLIYRRFGFNNYLQHQLMFGFVLILLGKIAEGHQHLQDFCTKQKLNFSDPLLQESIQKCEAIRTTGP